MRLNASFKTAVRRATRVLGYDLVPFAGGITSLQVRLLQSIPVVVDVGANVGQYAERLRDLGYHGRIISFEPNIEAYGILQAKVARQRCRWDIHQVALSSEPGTATLNVSANSVSSSLLTVREEHLRAAPASTTIDRQVVAVSTLDLELTGVGEQPLWIKLDVQGLELPVLRGAQRTLDNTLVVQAEISFDDLYEGQTNWLELCQFLGSQGFTLRYLDGGYEDQATGYMLQADVLFMKG
jgi:FkbM family methyltransferase